MFGKIPVSLFYIVFDVFFSFLSCFPVLCLFLMGFCWVVFGFGNKKIMLPKLVNKMLCMY